MQLDFSGAEIFLDYRDGNASAEQVLAHPAYRTVARHGQLFGSPIGPSDLDRAMNGEPSPFYGLEKLSGRIGQVRRLLDLLRRDGEAYLANAQAELSRLFPGEDLDIVVYPIIGYDMGIGLDGAVCMNANHGPYLAEPQEFLFYLIHECVHVIYERSHHVPALVEVESPAEWLAYFRLWLQNEGYAVYAPCACGRSASAWMTGITGYCWIPVRWRTTAWRCWRR